MEAIEFINQKRRMCDYYGDDTCVCNDSRGVCPALDIDCSFTTDNPERLIAIVEKWVKEHPEKQEEEAEETNNEQSYGNNTLEGRVDHLEKCICEMNETLTCFIHDTVDEVRAIKNHAEYQDAFMQTKCVHVDSAEDEPKTNKDVLLAAFTDAKMDDNWLPHACPKRIDKHYNCGKFVTCSECTRAHWLAVADE